MNQPPIRPISIRSHDAAQKDVTSTQLLEKLAMPEASIKSDRSQTAKKVKVRTGCITCKIRKVKCDEIKPACKRCTDTGRKCDGYLSEDDVKKNRTRSLVAGRREKWSPPIPCIEINATCLLGMPTAEERIWLSHFSTRTGPMLSGLSDKDFWSRILPQLSSKEPAIRHALLAVSSSYAHFEAEAATDRMMSMIGYDRPVPADASMERGLGAVSHGFTIKHYNLAIVSLQKNLMENPGKVELPLICCLLFICLECLYGNRLLMLNHLRNGLNILNSAQFWDERSGSGFMVKQKLQTILRRLDAQSTLYGNPVKPSVEELDSAPASTLPMAFVDVFEVEQSLNTIISHCLNFIQTVHCGMYFSKENSPRSPFPLQARLQEQLLVWRNKLDNFETASPPPDSASRDLARALRIQYIAIFIYLSNCLELSETSYDAFHANFATIVSLARPLILPETSTPPHPTPPPSPPSSPAPSLAIFTLDASLIPPLFLCAIKCRDSRIRRAAIDLMDANPCREGLWDARLHSLVARRVVEIEEGGCGGGPDGDGGEGGAMSLPETVRARIQPPLLPGEPLLVHRADIHAAAEQPEGAAARMTVYALRAGVLGEWVVWEEELGWARAPARKDSAEKWCRAGIVGESQLPERGQLCRNV